jgi:hypothetical protein
MITNDTLATPTSGIVAKYSTFIHHSTIGYKHWRFLLR